jgi:two-component system, sporulation sensor kinase E
MSDPAPAGLKKAGLPFGWGFRQTLILLLLAVILVFISGLLELANVVRSTVDGAQVESRLITKTLLLQIEQAVQGMRGDPYRVLREDRRIQSVLAAATAEAPSVVYAAICDSSGVALAHTTPETVGRRMEPAPGLPEVHSLRSSLRLLLNLRRSPPVYGAQSGFRLWGRPATISIGIGGGLLRERVSAVFRRGLQVALLQLALALAVGFGLAGILRGRLRQLEVGVAALREGRFDARIPDAGVDEFSRLARDLNLLSEQFARERQGQDASLRQTVDLLGDGILTFGPDRRLVLANSPAEQILGLPASSVGLSLDRVLTEDHPVRRLAERLYSEGAHTLSVALPGNGSKTAHVAVGHRISGRDRAGGVLIEIKRTEALREIHSLVDHSRVLTRLGQMAAGVAHEIRNPLQTINLELGILRGAKNLSSDEVSEHVRTALDEIQRLQRAVSGFLKVARLQRMSLDSLDPADLLEEIHQAHEAEANLAGLDLELIQESTLPEITADREVLRQALQNLVRNAIQATPSREGRVILRGAANGEEIRLSVEDTGPGIPPENMERVFDLYFTTKEGGSGVGLALVRQAVEMHNGRVELASKRGEGTVVQVRIPVRSVLGEV